MRKSLYTITTFARLNAKRFFRDKLAIFFTIVFPLMFLFVFGALTKNNGSVSFNVAVINQSSSSYAKNFVDQAKTSKILKVDKKTTSLDQATEKMKRSQLDATIVLPNGFGDVLKGSNYPSGQAVVYYNENAQQGAQTLTSILQQQFDVVNAQHIKLVTPLSVVAQSTQAPSLNRFDYTFSGLLGFSILGLGVFGPVNVFPELKKQGILRRFHTTPLRVWQYFVANVISQGFVGLFAIAALFMSSVAIFHLHMKGSYFTFIFFVLLSIFTIYGIGLALGGWAKNERQAAPLSNLVTFPMLFLSGTFFPRYLMPDWLQTVSGYLPLTPVVDGIRLIVTEGKGFLDVLPQMGLLLGWSVIIYLVAFRVFSWE